jgi:uracil-DNA glycosylase, family 4
MGMRPLRADGTVGSCERCPRLVASRSQIVEASGPLSASILFVGEAPGATEDTEGVPFCGRSGAILDEALAAAGLQRDAVRITNCVRCRPPENRDPHVAERANCAPYLSAEIALVDPAVIVPLGRIAGEALLGEPVRITAATGSTQRVQVAGQAYPVLICMHPAATLYDRSLRPRFDAAIAAAARLG